MKERKTVLTYSPEDHIRGFVDSFITKSKRSRFFQKWLSAKHRRSAMKELYHFSMIDFESYVEVISFFDCFSKKQIKPSQVCYVLSADEEYDGIYIDANRILSELTCEGGWICSIIPGSLAFYQSEFFDKRTHRLMFNKRNENQQLRKL